MYVLSSVEPFVISTFDEVPLKPVPLHPANVYPVLVGFLRVIVSVSIVYAAGLPAAFVPPSNT